MNIHVPDDWCKGIIKPLHKSGFIYDLDKYRGITLTSIVNKVFSKILETLMLDFLESNNILGETQGAFRKDRRIENQIFSLHPYINLQENFFIWLFWISQMPLIESGEMTFLHCCGKMI